jgi:hypothetical protein
MNTNLLNAVNAAMIGESYNTAAPDAEPGDRAGDPAQGIVVEILYSRAPAPANKDWNGKPGPAPCVSKGRVCALILKPVGKMFSPRGRG